MASDAILPDEDTKVRMDAHRTPLMHALEYCGVVPTQFMNCIFGYGIALMWQENESPHSTSLCQECEAMLVNPVCAIKVANGILQTVLEGLDVWVNPESMTYCSRRWPLRTVGPRRRGWIPPRRWNAMALWLRHRSGWWRFPSKRHNSRTRWWSSRCL